MQVTASIDHTTVIDLTCDGVGLAVFLLEKASEWASGRRSGQFTIDADGGPGEVWFADVTRFEVTVAL